MVIQRSCGPQFIGYCNPLHILERSTPRQTLLLTSLPKSRKFKVRTATIDAPPPVINLRQSTTLADLVPVSVEEAAKLLQSAPNEQCQLNPLPTWILKKSADRFAPLFAALCNSSYSSGLPVATISKTSLGISLTQENYAGPRRPELLPADFQLIVCV